jgi:hypothetical protein
MDEPVRHHPILGELRWDEQLRWWDAHVELAPGIPVAFCLSDDGGDQANADPDKLFAAGGEYLAWARAAEPRCRQRIADDLLDCYNDVWANTGPDNPDGGPGLLATRDEFIARIRPSAVHLHTDGSGAWYYDDGDLFAGHSIEVWVSADRVFSGAHLAG